MTTPLDKSLAATAIRTEENGDATRYVFENNTVVNVLDGKIDSRPGDSAAVRALGFSLWMKDGLLHRTTGPAVKSGNHLEFWLDGERVDEADIQAPAEKPKFLSYSPSDGTSTSFTPKDEPKTEETAPAVWPEAKEEAQQKSVPVFEDVPEKEPEETPVHKPVEPAYTPEGSGTSKSEHDKPVFGGGFYTFGYRNDTSADTTDEKEVVFKDEPESVEADVVPPAPSVEEPEIEEFEPSAVADDSWGRDTSKLTEVDDNDEFTPDNPDDLHVPEVDETGAERDEFATETEPVEQEDIQLPEETDELLDTDAPAFELAEGTEEEFEPAPIEEPADEQNEDEFELPDSEVDTDTEEPEDAEPAADETTEDSEFEPAPIELTEESPEEAEDDVKILDDSSERVSPGFSWFTTSGSHIFDASENVDDEDDSEEEEVIEEEPEEPYTFDPDSLITDENGYVVPRKRWFTFE